MPMSNLLQGNDKGSTSNEFIMESHSFLICSNSVKIPAILQSLDYARRDKLVRPAVIRMKTIHGKERERVDLFLYC